VAARRFVGLSLPAAGVCLAAALCAVQALAEETAPPTAAAPPTPQAAKPARPAPAPASSSWQRLSANQKKTLAPLAGTWDSLSAAHQRKWLEVSKNYPSLGAGEQVKMHERMTEWAALKPQERAQARLNFGKTTEIAKELSPAEKLARWQAYQALSPEERQKLAENAKSRPLGAAPAIKPVPAQKLAVVPPVATAKAKTVESSAAPAEPADSN
jgi:hypothetical protein